jgi:hypothetical protein
LRYFEKNSCVEALGRCDAKGEVRHAPETDGGAAVEAGPHQKELGGEPGRLWAAIGIPVRTVGTIPGTALEDAEAGAAVGPFALGPVPHVAAQVVTAEGGTAGGKGRDGRGAGVGAVVANVRAPVIAPRIFELIRSGGGVIA